MAGRSKVLNLDKSKNIELEGKSKQDSAWRDCEVSLSSADSSRASLHVHFASFKNDENNIILQKEEALGCLRVRSKDLSAGECLQVKEGETVIALQKTHSGRHYFFDAEVEKVKRWRHSNKVFCRCTFEIRWLESELKGERMTVPASSIKRLVQESIADHPIVSAFFEAVKSAKHRPLSPELIGSFPEDSDNEIDIHARLEQQIEEITKLAGPRENTSTEDTLCKHIRDYSKQSRENVNASDECTWSNKDGNRYVPPRKSRRKKNIVSSEKFPKDPITVNVAALLHLEKRPRLSPLAARAALAATVWDSPLGKQRMDDLKIVLERNDQDYFGPMVQSKHHKKGKKVPKIAISIAQEKSSKHSSSSKNYTNQVHHGHKNTKDSQTVSSDYSRLRITPKQEGSSDNVSTAKESSAMTDINVPSTQQRIRKRQREASKEVNSTRSRNKHLGVAPTRSSPRFRVGSVSDKEETSGRETQKNEPTVTENARRKTNGSSAATSVNGRKQKTEKKPPDLNEQEPESTTVSVNPLQGRSMLRNNDTEHYQKSSKNPQENGYNHSKQNDRAASVEQAKSKHLLTDDCTENTNGAITEGSKDGGYDNCALDKASLEAKKKKRRKMSTSNHVEHRSSTNDSAENSLGTVEERLHSERSSKVLTPKVKRSKKNISSAHMESSDGGDESRQQSPSRSSKVLTSGVKRSKKDISPAHLENSDAGDERRQQSAGRKKVFSEEGEYSRRGRAGSDKNLKAQLQVSPEMKHRTSRDVTQGSPGVQFLPRTRSQKNQTGHSTN
ncbi:hypothetical protein KI387_005551 [Taxus chinensis]|uniref:SAWADEE domain-containing protein n=1 Tax=Taxus chinensis TaxID=29808 RepID=A0AA38GNH8_TAXCH|nr:hypothetical protein KI387_005551 [Taxus chinensis]